MNIWIAKLGDRSFTEENMRMISDLLRREFDTSTLEFHDLFEYKTPFIHYLSFEKEKENLNKSYNHIDAENKLTAYSGILVGKTSEVKDYRSAGSIQNFSRDPHRFSYKIAGHFSVIGASDSEFQCFVDNTGLHKVFYFESSDKQVYVTNFIDLIKLFKKPQINTDAFLDWITLESILFQETEEKNIYTLPEYGMLTWSSENGFKTEQYKDLIDFFYNPPGQKRLFDTAVSELRACAEYLSAYHDCVIPLSGGFDSRLTLSMFWGLNKSRIESYTLFDNYEDIPVAKRVAKDHSIPHRELILPDEFPTLEELHNNLMKERFPFFKYSKVFEYLADKSLEKIYSGRNQVQIKGTGGNSDRRILEYSFLDEFKGDEAIQKLSDHLLNSEGILNHKAFQYMKQRIRSYYQQKYLPVITGRGKEHKLKCILFKDRLKQTANSRHTQIHPLFDDWFFPLLIDSFQTLAFNNSSKSKLIRSKKESIYHQLFQAFTNGQDKPIHFTSGLHWEASKLSRGIYRVQKSFVERHLKSRFAYKEKNSFHIKSEFFKQNKPELLDVLVGTENSILWDYLDRNFVIEKFRDTEQYDDMQVQLIFQKVIPFLKMEYSYKTS